MDKAYVLGRLASKQPLFQEIPSVARKRICGTENEYGVADEYFGSADLAFANLPAFLPNGGLLYHDCYHLEYASPETADVVSMVAYHEAGKAIAWQGNYCKRLFCHNNDWQGSTFGAHESYFTSLPRSRWDQLVPFLIARTVITGNGWFAKRGPLEDHLKFELSQRARYITCALGLDTTTNRPMVNTRVEPLANFPRHDRLHLVCGDANMSEVSTFLKIGITGLFLEMLEMGALPSFRYDDSKTARDIGGISRKTAGWYLGGLKGHCRGVIEFLGFCLARAEELFKGRDMVTDSILIIWEDTLEKLAGDPASLACRLDWVAKRSVLTDFMENQKDWTEGWLQSQDMEYHSLNPEEGLYLLLRAQGQMERIVSDAMIERAVAEPPSNTRAYIRGKLTQHFLRMAQNPGGFSYFLQKESWNKLGILSAGRGSGKKDDRILSRTESYAVRLPDSLLALPDPFCTYEDRLQEIIEVLG